MVDIKGGDLCQLKKLVYGVGNNDVDRSCLDEAPANWMSLPEPPVE